MKKVFLVFWVFVFDSFRVDFFCVEKAFLSMLRVCMLVCVSMDISFIFFALNPLKRFVWTSFLLC